MKKNLVFVYVAAFAVAFSSCGGGEEKKETPGTGDTTAKTEEVKPACLYSYNNDSTTVKWIAYKLTEKVGVEGYFDSVVVSGTTESEDPKTALTGATFTIYTSSTNTADKARDEKINKFFFGKFVSTEITGTVKSFSEDGASATIAVSMNGIEKEITGEVVWDDQEVVLKSAINLEDFNGQDAIKSLNKACKEKHTGTDGVLKLWPDVTIMVRTSLNKNCPN